MRAALALVTALALCLFAARAHAQTFTTPPRVERLRLTRRLGTR